MFALQSKFRGLSTSPIPAAATCAIARRSSLRLGTRSHRAGSPTVTPPLRQASAPKPVEHAQSWVGASNLLGDAAHLFALNGRALTPYVLTPLNPVAPPRFATLIGRRDRVFT